MDILYQYPDILELFNRNNVDSKNKILQILTKKPTQADGIGWIYGFYSPKDKSQNRNNFWIKLGRTERNPFHRVEYEWGGEMIFCLKTSYNYRLERLVHLFFDFARKERKGICEDKFDPIKSKTISTQTDDVLSNNHNVKISNWEKILNFFSCLCCLHRSNKPLEKQIVQDLIVKKEDISLSAEKEWFHFQETINIPFLVSQLWLIVELTCNGTLLKSEIYCEEQVNFVKININTGTFDELITLPHIGKVIATKIIEHRRTKQFVSVDELKIVHPSLEFKIDKLKNRICVQ